MTKNSFVAEVTFNEIQEPAIRSTITRVFAFLAKFAEFYYHKIFEKRS